MTVIEEYEAAASAGKWLEALQLAQQIAERAPHPTCWFNVGVCLDELNRHMEAAQAFQRVIAGDYFDDGARFRMLRSLFLTGDSGVQIVHDEIATIVRALPQVVVELSQLETFTSLFKQDEFAVLKTAAERNLETRRTSLQHLSGEGFVFSEPIPLRQSDHAIALRSMTEIGRRVLALQCVFLYVSSEGESVDTREISNCLESNDVGYHLAIDEQEIFSRSRSQAQAEFGGASGWYLERMLPLAWILGFEGLPRPDGKALSGSNWDALFPFVGKPSTCKLASWLTTFKARDEACVIEMEDAHYCAHIAMQRARSGEDTVPDGFDPVFNGGVILERWHSLLWALSPTMDWEEASF